MEIWIIDKIISKLVIFTHLEGGSAMENVEETTGDQEQEPTESPGSKRPFQFSDFKKQPVRPESPNVSDCSGGRRDSTSALPDDPDDDVFKTGAAEQEEVGRRKLASRPLPQRERKPSDDGGKEGRPEHFTSFIKTNSESYLF